MSDNAQGSQAWTNPQNAATSDDARATSSGLTPGSATHRLDATDFNFLLPGNASILGFEVFLERSQGGNGTAKDQAMRLLKGGAAVPAEQREPARRRHSRTGSFPSGSLHALRLRNLRPLAA